MTGNNKWHGPLQILSLDGGGVKGLFSAAVLANLERDLSVRIIDHFDLIAGTSTGGIIAIALGLGLSPREIVDFYTQDAPRIFRTKKVISACKHAIYRKHSPDDLAVALQKRFGERKFGESGKRLVVPAYDLGRGAVHVFKTPHHERFRRDHRVPAWQVAMATGAAPTYFPVFDKVDGIRLVDGGVWANNPTMVAVVEACGVLGATLAEVNVLSVGTTIETIARPPCLNWGGLAQWAKPATEVMLQAQCAAANGMAELMLGKEHFLRVNPVVPAGMFKLDKCNTESHLSYASACSRELSPQFRNRFQGHKAAEYIPLHTTHQSKNATPKSANILGGYNAQ